jgi:hypothetical protein
MIFLNHLNLIYYYQEVGRSVVFNQNNLKILFILIYVATAPA